MFECLLMQVFNNSHKFLPAQRTDLEKNGESGSFLGQNGGENAECSEDRVENADYLRSDLKFDMITFY